MLTQNQKNLITAVDLKLTTALAAGVLNPDLSSLIVPLGGYAGATTEQRDEVRKIFLTVFAALASVLEDWTEVGAVGAPAFQNSWANYGPSHNHAAFFKDPFGTIYLCGLVKDGTLPGVIFTLPATYRPPKVLVFPVSSNTAFGEVQVGTGGEVTVAAGSNAGVSLEGIAFRTT